MSPWIIWLIATAVLLLIEVLSSAVWALCFALGTLVTMFVSLFTDSIVAQALTPPIAAILAWILLAPAIRKWESRRSRQSRTGMDALLGRKAIVTEEIKPGQCGRARIDGDYWQVRAPGCDYVIKRGEEVSVTAYDSIILTVEESK